MTNRTRCVVCAEPGRARDCCPDEPVFCAEHYEIHRMRVHEDTARAENRSVDEALAQTLEAEGFEETEK